ncbi:MAG TPA: hypothetical protein VLU25_22445 [Acidobacteriota bacterium]|nr:hypothetical protein [Acidobacteriota bacterium]
MLSERDYQDLLEYLEGGLEEPQAKRLEMRLQASRELREEYEKIRFGHRLMEGLEPTPMPAERASRLRSRLLDSFSLQTPGEDGSAAASEGRFPSAWLAVAALLVVAVATGLLLQLRQPSVRLRLAQDAPGMLERAAFTLHTGKHSTGPVINLASASLSDTQQWVRRTAGLQLETDIPPTPMNCCQDVNLRQACKTSVQGCTALALRYEVEGHAVTLLMAEAGRVPDAPEPSLWHKEVVFRPAGADGLKTLSWTEGGQTYTLVSDLPEYGQKACMLCHLEEGTRRTIENLQLTF